MQWGGSQLMATPSFMRLTGQSIFSVVLYTALLSGCGTLVPEIRDFPHNGSYAQNNQLVQAIVQSIHCEVEDAVTRVLNEKSSGGFSAQFLRKWGAQVALTLQLEEKTIVSPSAVWTPPTPRRLLLFLRWWRIVRNG